MNSLTRVTTLYAIQKHFINEHIMLKAYCFQVHASAISVSFAEVLGKRETECFYV